MKNINSKFNELQSLITSNFNSSVSIMLSKLDEVVLETDVSNLESLCFFLKTNKEFKFEQLVDLCCVDFSTFGSVNWDTSYSTENSYCRGVDVSYELKNIVKEKQRFCLIYHLLSYSRNFRLRIRSFVDNEKLAAPSVVKIWAGVNWFEREAFDLFGIKFLGHPFLHKILTDYNFVGYPMRKDFQLIGYKDLRYDNVLKKCVYDTVCIDNVVLNAKVIR